MRGLAWLVVVLFAGCAGSDETSTGESSPPSESSDTTPASPPPGPPGGAPPQGTTTNATLLPGEAPVQSLTWTLANASFSTSLVHYLLVAHGNVTLAWKGTLDVAGYAADRECFVISAQSGTAGSLMFASLFENDLRAEAMVAGTGVQSPEVEAGSSGSLGASVDLQLNLTAGETVTFVHGGTTPAFLSVERQADGVQVATSHVEWRGPATVTATTETALHCGIGPRGTQEATAVARYGYTVSQLGGHARLSTTQGTLVLWYPPFPDDTMDAELSVAGVPLDLTQVQQVAQGPGEVALEVTSWTSPGPSGAWLLLDLAWP